MRQDLRVALRDLRRRPLRAALVIVLLGLGTAGTTTIFSLVDSLLLSPLPFDEPERLVWLDETAPEWGLESVSIDFADFHAWRESSHTFDSLALIRSRAFNLVVGETVERVEAAGVTHELDRVLRAGPVRGRMFTAEEDAPGGPAVAILSDGLGRRLFGGDPAAALGRTLRLDGTPHEIVGVLPPGLRLPVEAQLWVPVAGEPEDVGSYRFEGIGRLEPGVTPAAAKRDLDRTLEPLIEKYPFKKAVSSVVTPFRDQLVGSTGGVAWALLAAVALVLVVACVDVAALQLARGTARQREMGVRTAIGARRGRLVRQLLTEGLVLAAAGGAVGLLLGAWGLGALRAALGEELPFWVSFTPRPEALLICLAAGVGTTLLFGLLPALTTSRVSVTEALRAGAGGLGAGRSGRRSLSALVVGEMALAQVLLVGAGLVLLSQRQLLRVDPGYRAEDALSFGVALPRTAYPEDADRLALYRELRRRLAALPGVASVALSTNLPLQGHDGFFFEAEGRSDPDSGVQREVTLVRQASDAYAATMGIPVVRGRELGAGAAAGELREVLVNERFAELYWPDQDPVGRRIRAGDHRPWLTVVGVSRNVRHYGLAERVRPGVYVPLGNDAPSRMSFVLRTAVDPRGVIPSARGVVRGLDPELPLYRVATLEEELARSLGLRRLTSALFGLFAAVALTLAAGGTFGVAACLVQRRTPEIGLRIALGASSRSVLGLVLRQGAVLAAGGASLGLLAALGAGRLLEGLLFQVDARDPRVFASVAALLLGTAVLANLVPAVRAARIEPMRALRED